MMTGRALDAERAARLGFVSEICPAEELAARAERLVDELLAASTQGLALTKHGITVNLGAASLEAAVELEDRQQAMLAGSAEFRARVAAFVAQRAKP
jgi:enoyl-CoA hydratase/carnithine racemase